MPDAQLVKRQFSHAEMNVIRAYERLDYPNQSRVARELGLSKQTVSEHLTKPDLKAELARREQRRTDQARSGVERAVAMLSRAEAILGRVLEQVELAAEDPTRTAGIDVAGVLATVKVAGEVSEKLAAFADRMPAPPASEHLDAYKRKLSQAVRVGAYIERRRARADAGGWGSRPGSAP